MIHNYGHGGSGVVVSWGTAEEVAQMARQVAAGKAREGRITPQHPRPVHVGARLFSM